MSNTIIFDLEKVKEITEPVKKLQSSLIELKKNSIKLGEIAKEILVSEELALKDKQLSKLFSMIHKLDSELIKATNNNISSLLSVQAELIKKYRINYKNNLKNLNLNQQKVKDLGLSLIKRKTISTIISEISYIPSVNFNEWLEILDSLKENSLFRKSIEKLGIFNKILIEKRLEKELTKIPKDTDPLLIEKFKKAFLRDNDLIFNIFIKEYNLKLTDEALSTRKESIEKAKKKEELEKIKKNQEEQNQSYEDYLNLSSKEFERRRRKKRREKLSEIEPDKNPSKKLNVSDEISEKIEQFKSQFDKKYQEDYLNEDDDQRDPIEIIRERKKLKTEEFKKYKNHFD
jgi:hypothetical protein